MKITKDSNSRRLPNMIQLALLFRNNYAKMFPNKFSTAHSQNRIILSTKQF